MRKIILYSKFRDKTDYISTTIPRSFKILSEEGAVIEETKEEPSKVKKEKL